MDFLDSAHAALRHWPWALTILQLAGLLVAVWLSKLATHFVLVRVITRAARSTATDWDDMLLGRGVTSQLARIVPALLIYYGIDFIGDLPRDVVLLVRGVTSGFVVLAVTLALGSLLNVVEDIYQRRDPERARARPIKGYLQVAKIVIYLLSAVLIIATLFNRSPLLLLSGLGAMTAVLLLVFKDTILSLVASVQLTTNDMMRVGDWITMPQLNADGFVIDMSLNTVKVRNWDHTITTIPTWRLISESYMNWRGVFDSGGRKIQRSIHIDQTSVRFLSDAECGQLRRFALLDEYLERKDAEIGEFNTALQRAGKDPINRRRITNVGTFRAYVQAYIESHPGIHQGMYRLARQLQPGPTGLPLEIYCYASKTAWADYEGIQADIFDHLYAILPEFGLRVFQQPTGLDIRRTLHGAHAAQADGPAAALLAAPVRPRAELAAGD